MALQLGHLAARLVVVGSVVDQPILVAAAGLVVVLAILLVFVMVLRGGGKRTSVGIGYDMQQGPLGQPKSPPSQPGNFGPRAGMPAQGWGQAPDFGAPAGPSGQNYNSAQGWGQNYQNPWNEQAPAQAPAQTPAQAPAWNIGAPGGPGGQWQDQASWGQAPTAQPAFQGTWGQQQNPAAAQGWGQPADTGGAWGGAPAAPSSPAQQGYGAPPAAGSGWTGGVAPMGGAPDPYGPVAGYGDADRARAMRPANAPRAALLIVRQGKEPGRTYEVRKDRMTIGRSRESDIFLEDLAVSRIHTSIGRDDHGRYVVRDENSANGTYVNGQRIAEQVLEDGDEVQVGQTVLAFTRR